MYDTTTNDDCGRYPFLQHVEEYDLFCAPNVCDPSSRLLRLLQSRVLSIPDRKLDACKRRGKLQPQKQRLDQFFWENALARPDSSSIEKEDDAMVAHCIQPMQDSSSINTKSPPRIRRGVFWSLAISTDL